MPRSMAPAFPDRLAAEIHSIPMGEVTDFRNFLGAVIDWTSFDTLSTAITRAKASKNVRVLAGGSGDSSRVWCIEPALILAKEPRFETMETELFGPVLPAYIYDEGDMEAAYRLVDGTSPYALTGSIFATDRSRVVMALEFFKKRGG